VDTFEPLINVLVVLTVLSVAAERVTNMLKLRHEDLRDHKSTESDEREREYRITGRNMLVGVALAILVKADIFAILANLANPWDTLGWLQSHGESWTRAAALGSFGTFIYSIGGSVITGFALGFGSKFWHDLLGIAYELRDMARQSNKAALAGKGVTAHGDK
jgi:hypothetical protein